MTKINLKKFEKNLVVRPLRPSDWEGVVALQKRCFPGMEPWSRETLDELVIAMAHWLEAAERRATDPIASSRALDEVRRRLAALRRPGYSRSTSDDT